MSSSKHPQINQQFALIPRMWKQQLLGWLAAIMTKTLVWETECYVCMFWCCVCTCEPVPHLLDAHGACRSVTAWLLAFPRSWSDQPPAHFCPQSQSLHNNIHPSKNIVLYSFRSYSITFPFKAFACVSPLGCKRLHGVVMPCSFLYTFLLSFPCLLLTSCYRTSQLHVLSMLFCFTRQ